jgi:2-keto-3-deoxy-L-fuconate dehydrogenase
MQDDLFDLTGKTALITGGGSGIGQAIARLFARRGATVHILELTADHARQTLDQINHAGGTAAAHPADVSRQSQVQAVVSSIGRVDILVNNAGIAHVGTAETTSEADFDRVFAVNVRGVYNCLHTVIPGMKANGGGAILNMCSIGAHVGLTDRFAYSMSKGAIQAITLSVARDYLASGIRCNGISPARVHTPFVDGFIAKNYPGQEAEMFARLSASQPIGRMAQPDEVATMALYLCSDQAAFLTGNDYLVDGGFVHLNT